MYVLAIGMFMSFVAAMFFAVNGFEHWMYWPMYMSFACLAATHTVHMPKNEDDSRFIKILKVVGPIVVAAALSITAGVIASYFNIEEVDVEYVE